MGSWASLFLLLASSGCSAIVSSTLDGKNSDGDADGDTDGDTDTDGCSLEGAFDGVTGDHDIDFAGGGENGPTVIAPGEDIASAGAELAILAKWGSGTSFGYETQVFDSTWDNVTGHNRVQSVAQDPMSFGSIWSSNDTLFAVFPQNDGPGSILKQVPLTFNAVGHTLDEGTRVDLLSHGVQIRGPSSLRAGTHAFYFYAEASAVEGGDSSAFAAMSPLGEAAGTPIQLNPGSGHHAAVSGAYSRSNDRVVFVYERTSAGAGDVLYGLLDPIPSIVQAAAPGISPPGAQSGAPSIAVEDGTAIVTYSSRPGDPGNFDLHYQVLNVTADEVTLEESGVLSNADTDAGASFVVYHPDLEEFGVVWTEFTPGPADEIWAARLDFDGTQIQGPTLVSDEAGERPAVSMAPVSFGYAIVWDGGPDVGLKTGWLGCVPES